MVGKQTPRTPPCSTIRAKLCVMYELDDIANRPNIFRRHKSDAHSTLPAATLTVWCPGGYHERPKIPNNNSRFVPAYAVTKSVGRSCRARLASGCIGQRG